MLSALYGSLVIERDAVIISKRSCKDKVHVFTLPLNVVMLYQFKILFKADKKCV